MAFQKESLTLNVKDRRRNLNVMFGKPQDIIRMTMNMEFYTMNGFGVANIEWYEDKNPTDLSRTQLKILCVTALYARILVSHKEIRQELLERVSQAAQTFTTANRFVFEDWYFSAAGSRLQLWPWQFGETFKPKKYEATIFQKGGSLGFNLKMAWGLERILAPSSVMIAVASLSSELADDGNMLLGRGLLSVKNEYANSGSFPIGSDIRALSNALFNITAI
jgi:hypothetical protein